MIGLTGRLREVRKLRQSEVFHPLVHQKIRVIADLIITVALYLARIDTVDGAEGLETVDYEVLGEDIHDLLYLLEEIVLVTALRRSRDYSEEDAKLACDAVDDILAIARGEEGN